MEKRTIHSDQAPRAIGPYSQAVAYGNFVFTAGQIGLDTATGELAGEGIESQTRQTLTNLEAVLCDAGVSFNDVVKSVIYLVDLADFPIVNEIYAERFKGSPPPARSTVQVAGLPVGALVEIDMIACLPEGAKAL